MSHNESKSIDLSQYISLLAWYFVKMWEDSRFGNLCLLKVLDFLGEEEVVEDGDLEVGEEGFWGSEAGTCFVCAI